MKRIIIVLTLVVPMLTWGEWEIVEHKGDELKGVTAYRSFSFGNSSENGSGEVVLYDAPDNQIKLICPKYTFFKTIGDWGRVSNGEFSNQDFAVAKVGFYRNGELVKKGTMLLMPESDKSQFGYLKNVKYTGKTDAEIRKDFAKWLSSDIETIREHTEQTVKHLIALRDAYTSIPRMDIYNALCHPGMSVRIIADRYGETRSFDVTIPANECFQQIGWIPANRNRAAAARRNAQIAEAEKRIADEIAAREKAQEEARAKNAEKVGELEKEYAEYERRHGVAIKGGYKRAAEKYQAEMDRIKAEIDKLKAGK